MNDRWWNSAAWMRNPNIRLMLVLVASAMPVIIADLSTGMITWVTLCVVLVNMVTATHAFMADPKEFPADVVDKMVAAVDDVKAHVNDKVDQVADEVTTQHKKK